MTGWKPASRSPGCRPARSRHRPAASCGCSGLNSSRWPRGIAEDRLISDHIIPTAELDPLPVERSPTAGTSRRSSPRPSARSFSRAPAATATAVFSDAARCSPGMPTKSICRRNAMPEHAFSETDRFMARPQEFAADPQAVSAHGCWRDWRRAKRSRRMTVSSGPIIRSFSPFSTAPSRPARFAACCAIRSASSGVYAFGWRGPESSDDPLVLDALGDRRSRPHDSRPRLCATSRPKAGCRVNADEIDRSGGGRSRRAMSPTLGERTRGPAGRHLAPHAR